MLGMHGTYEANMAMQHCDVLIAIGARFDDRVIGNPAHFASRPRKIIHIDIDPSSISKRVKVDMPIVGDVKEVLEGADRAVADRRAWPGRRRRSPTGGRRSKQWRAKDCLKFDRKSAIIKPQYVIEKLYEMTGGDAFITFRRRPAPDVGRAVLRFNKPRRWINSGGLGTMGFGLPAAMGVKMANPGATVPASPAKARSRCASRNCRPASSTTCRSRSLSLNNRYMGMVRQWQQIDVRQPLFASRTWMRCRISSSLPRRTATSA